MNVLENFLGLAESTSGQFNRYTLFNDAGKVREVARSAQLAMKKSPKTKLRAYFGEALL